MYLAFVRVIERYKNASLMRFSFRFVPFLLEQEQLSFLSEFHARKGAKITVSDTFFQLVLGEAGLERQELAPCQGRGQVSLTIISAPLLARCLN